MINVTQIRTRRQPRRVALRDRLFAVEIEVTTEDALRRGAANRIGKVVIEAVGPLVRRRWRRELGGKR